MEKTLRERMKEVEQLAKNSSSLEASISDLTEGVSIITDVISDIPKTIDAKITKAKDELKLKDGKDGKNGKDGKDGVDGKNGVDGIDGVDGSPDTGKDIAKKLNTLKGVINKDVIIGLDFASQSDIDRAVSILDQRTQYLINKNSNSGGGGSVTVGVNEIAYGDDSGEVTSDADHTLLADGTLTLSSTFGDVTASFVQRIEPTLGNAGIWGTTSTNNSTGAGINILMIDGTNSADLGNDSALLTVAQFPSTDVQYNHFIANAGTFLGISVGADIIIEENITSAGYELGVYDLATPAGSNIFASPLGAGVLSRDLSSYGSGYDVYSIDGTVYADDTGVTSRVQTGKDIVDYVQTGTSNSIPVFIGSGTDDLSISGDYTGAYTGNYSITVIGQNGTRVVFNGGMTTGDQFAVGEVVTGSISGATAVVSNGTSGTRIWAYDVTGTGFVNGDILTGDQGNVSTAVTTAGNAPGVGDLFEVNYSDIKYTNVQWFTGNQAYGTPFPGIGGIEYEFTISPTGHTPNARWTFTATALYEAKQVVDVNGTSFLSNPNGTFTYSKDIPITQKIPVTSSQINNMFSNPIATGISVQAGCAAQILDVYARITYATTPYATNTNINIAFQTAPTQSIWQQNTLLTDTATTIRRFTKTSGAGAEIVIDNDSFVITNTSGDPTAGDSDIDVYITYKIITL